MVGLDLYLPPISYTNVIGSTS